MLRRIAPVAALFWFGCAMAWADASPDARHTYMVRLNDAPLVEHALQRIAQRRGSKSLGSDKQAVRRELDGADSAAYRQQLDSKRERILDAGSTLLGRALTARHTYRYTGNGVALLLSENEAASIAALPGVSAVRRERIEHVLTDAGPQWIGADGLWNGQVPGIPATRGEGVVIGIIDTGINPSHPSFAATGGDGYTHTNPRGHFYGLCTNGNASCNAKLIGIYDMTDEGTQGVDSVGHGSHVSGIAAGNALTDALQGHTVALSRNVSGVAPHANIIMYKACKAATTAQPTGGCPESDLVAAIEQATVDSVDVINYSIGGDARDPYSLLFLGSNDVAAFFQARAAGIVAVAAAGNEGPGAGSIGEPANAPWIIAVANASHNRRFSNSIGGFSGASNAPSTLAGQGYTAGFGPATIVYAGNFGNALCGVGDTQGVSPTGASNPFAPGTFHGEIVICDRGTYARVEKGYNVGAAGAGGYILANAASDSESIVSDDHFLPAVHLGFVEGKQLKDWVNGAGAHTGTISGVSAVLDNSFGDVLDASSSRGPFGFSGGVLKPDITAPGDNILSSAQNGTGLALLSGTSMASPHVAGAAALLIAAHPTWSPAQVESALLGTALGNSVRKEDGVTPATSLDAGAGRARPATAALAGLFLPLSADDFSAQDPSRGGDLRKLNRSGIEDEHCFGQCNFTRTVTDMSGGGTWQASFTATAGASVTVSPSQFTLAPGASQVLNIAVDVSEPHLPGSWVSGRIVLHKSTGGQSSSDNAFALAVYSQPGSMPPFQQFTINAPTGNVILQPSGLVALPQATFSTTSLEPATLTNMNLGVDPTPGDLYSTFPGTGKQFVLFPISRISNFPGTHPPNMQGRVFIVEVASSDAAVTNLYAGVDSNGDGQPEFVEQACTSTTQTGGTARCVIDLRGAAASARNVWALVDIPQGRSDAQQSVALSSGVAMVNIPPGGDASGGRLTVTGPGHVPASASFPLRLTLGSVENALVPDRYYGAVTIDALPGLNGQSGFIPFALTRNPGGDDIADAIQLSTDSLRNYAIESGETLQHVFVDVAADTKSLNVITGEAESLTNSAPSMAFYVARADFPGASASPQIAAAPPSSAAVAQWTLGGAVSAKSVTIPVSPGRWYIVSTNTSSSENGFSLIVIANNTGTAVPPVPGEYYNPLRSGHGIFVSRAAGQQVVDWYTYADDGTPTWYAAQAAAPAPNSGAWTAPMARINWNGASVNTVAIVGDVILTPIDATSFMYSWHLDGQTGSEHFSLLGTNACVTFNGQPAKFDGNWYAPTQSGYGMDVLALPDLQFDAFYLYDSLGIARWVAGSSTPFAASTTMDMNQLTGFCPLCAYTGAAAQKVGTMSVNYASTTSGTYSTNFNLLAPLSGAWNINQPISRLTGSPACSQ
jgi:subtilisin family serine protease